MFLTQSVCLELRRKYIFISSIGAQGSQRNGRRAVKKKKSRKDILLTEGVSFSSDLSRSPCSKNSLVTSSATCKHRGRIKTTAFNLPWHRKRLVRSDLFGDVPWFSHSTQVTRSHHHRSGKRSPVMFKHWTWAETLIHSIEAEDGRVADYLTSLRGFWIPVEKKEDCKGRKPCVTKIIRTVGIFKRSQLLLNWRLKYPLNKWNIFKVILMLNKKIE